MSIRESLPGDIDEGAQRGDKRRLPDGRYEVLTYCLRDEQGVQEQRWVAEAPCAECETPGVPGSPCPSCGVPLRAYGDELRALLDVA